MEEDRSNIYIYRNRVQYFISTKAELLTDKVNEWIKDMEDNTPGFVFNRVDPLMSYTTMHTKDRDVGAYMIGCQVHYFIEEEINGDLGVEDDGIDPDNFGLTFPS